jgi:hypothetical protein
MTSALVSVYASIALMALTVGVIILMAILMVRQFLVTGSTMRGERTGDRGDGTENLPGSGSYNSDGAGSGGND